MFRLISGVADELGMPCFLIGGFVRDKLLGRISRDADLVCAGDGIQLATGVARALGDSAQVTVFKNFGTARVSWMGMDLEFVGARKESYGENSRKPIVSPGTLRQDQLRRDFTINALGISLNMADFGLLEDPFHGLQDLEDRIIRTPLEASRTFRDDPLRMMRAIRFASELQFRIEESTFSGITQEVERIRIVSAERITEELNKILLASRPSLGLDLLYKSGLLKLLFPQLVELVGVETVDGKGHKDNFYHTLQVLDNIAPRTDNLWLRWAALLHDIGKPATKHFEEGHGWTFHGHEVVGGRMVTRIFNQFRLPQNEKLAYVRKLVELHLRPIGLTRENITDSALRRLLFDAGEDLEDLMLLCEADITSRNQLKVRRYLDNFEWVRKRLGEVEEKDRIRNWQPPISGEMIMKHFNLPPGKQVGDIKNAIREAILDGEIGNNFEEAWALMLRKARELQLPLVQ